MVPPNCSHFTAGLVPPSHALRHRPLPRPPALPSGGPTPVRPRTLGRTTAAISLIISAFHARRSPRVRIARFSPHQIREECGAPGSSVMGEGAGWVGDGNQGDAAVDGVLEAAAYGRVRSSWGRREGCWVGGWLGLAGRGVFWHSCGLRNIGRCGPPGGALNMTLASAKARAVGLASGAQRRRPRQPVLAARHCVQ